jgi:hypothetical protein
LEAEAMLHNFFHKRILPDACRQGKDMVEYTNNALNHARLRALFIRIENKSVPIFARSFQAII